MISCFLFHPSADIQWNSVDSAWKRSLVTVWATTTTSPTLKKIYLSVSIWIDYWIFAQTYKKDLFISLRNILEIKIFGDICREIITDLSSTFGFEQNQNYNFFCIVLVHPEQGPFGGFNCQSKWLKSTSCICSALGHSCRHVTKLSGILWQCYIVPLF